MFRPTIYKRPHVYKSSAYKRYSIYKGAGEDDGNLYYTANKILF